MAVLVVYEPYFNGLVLCCSVSISCCCLCARPHAGTGNVAPNQVPAFIELTLIKVMAVVTPDDICLGALSDIEKEKAKEREESPNPSLKGSGVLGPC